jgi:hypothetical protein
MGRPDVSAAWRAVSPHHRRTDLRGDRVEVLGLLLRLVAVGLLGAVGWVHLHLWQEGYRHIPTIGPLFLAAAVSALVVGVGLLGRPSRLLGLLGIGTVIGIVAGLIVSVNVGLFGFTESLTAPFAVESIVLETAAAVTLAAWIAVDLLAESRHSQRATHDPGAPAPTAARFTTRPAAGGNAKPTVGSATVGGRAQLTRALDFHTVYECDCHGAADIAPLCATRPTQSLGRS